MKKLFIYITVLFCANTVFAQFSLKTSNQQFIEKALSNGVFMSKQSFQIRDKKSGELFGLNGKKEFGIQYSLGFKIKGGILLTDKAVNPWNYESKFDKYRDQYEPVLLDAYYADSKETADYTRLSYDIASKQDIVNGEIYKFSSEAFNGTGLGLDSSLGEKDGWLIWLTADPERDKESSSKISLTIYSKSINVNNEAKSFAVEPFNTIQEILGGIYVVASYKNVGCVEFNICGVLTKIDNEWKLVCPFVGMEGIEEPKEQVKEPEAPSEEGPSELTPINEKPSKKKSKK